MATVVLINGAPGSGKSTLAQRYVDAHPPALNLDVDRVRCLVGGWEQDLQQAGLLARRAALAMLVAHTGAGHDVVIPQYLGRLDFVEQLEHASASAGVGFVEVVLLDDKDEARRRFQQRTRSADALHRHAAADVAGQGGDAAFDAMYDALVRVIDARPGTRIVRVVDGDVDESYRRLLSAIGRDA